MGSLIVPANNNVINMVYVGYAYQIRSEEPYKSYLNYIAYNEQIYIGCRSYPNLNAIFSDQNGCGALSSGIRTYAEWCSANFSTREFFLV